MSGIVNIAFPAMNILVLFIIKKNYLPNVLHYILTHPTLLYYSMYVCTLTVKDNVFFLFNALLHHVLV